MQGLAAPDRDRILALAQQWLQPSEACEAAFHTLWGALHTLGTGDAAAMAQETLQQADPSGQAAGRLQRLHGSLIGRAQPPSAG